MVGQDAPSFWYTTMTAVGHKSYELLITDDDPGFRAALREVLEPYFQLMEASSGEEAIDIVRRHPVDILLLDMHMHRLTGLETLRVVKSLLVWLPCILITADATEELQKEAAEAQAYSVLRKPVTRRELVTTVSSALTQTYPEAAPLA